MTGAASSRRSEDRRRWLGGVAVLSVALASSLAVSLSTPLNFFDEGLILDGASRLLRGDIPYRDFDSAYGPGQFALVAVAFRLFGESLLTERVLDAFLRTSLLVSYTLLARRLCGPRYAAILLFTAAGTLFFVPSHGYPMTPALVLCVLALHAASKRRAFVAGLLCAVGIVFRPEVGALAAIAVGAVIIDSGPGQKTPEAQSVEKRLVLVAAGGATMLIPVAALLLALAGARAVWSNLVYEPLFVLGALRRLPLPPAYPPSVASNVGVRAFLVSWRFWGSAVIGITCLAIQLGGRRARSPEQNGLLLLFFGLLYFAISRADAVHLFPAVLVLPLVASTTRGPARSLGLRTAPALLLASAIAGALSYLEPPKVVGASLSKNVLSGCYSDLPKASCFALYPGQNEALVVAQRLTDEDDSVYVGLARHDRIFVNDMASYFLVERPASTSIRHLGPGSATRLSEQREIISDLVQADTQALIILDLGLRTEPNRSGREQGAHALDEFLAQNFKPVSRHGNYSIWLPSEH